MGYLRFLLALFVIIAHAGNISVPFFNHSSVFIYNFGGRNAVGLFFMISGFYMSLILTDKYKNSLKTFYINRALRIFPTYWLVLILGSFFLGANYNEIFSTLNQTTLFAKIYFYFSNIFIFGSDISYLVSARENGLQWAPFTLSGTHNGYPLIAIPTIFTVAIELMFYIIAPFMVRSIKLTFGILIGSIIYHLIFIATNDINIIFQYHLFPSSLLYFSLGILSHKMYLNKSFQLNNSLYLVFIILATAIMIIQPLLPNIIILIFPFLLPYLFQLTKNNRIDRLIGNLSYPLYIVHYSVLKYCLAHGYNKEKLGLIVSVASIVLAIIMHIIIEVPIEKYRAKKIQGL